MQVRASGCLPFSGGSLQAAGPGAAPRQARLHVARHTGAQPSRLWRPLAGSGAPAPAAPRCSRIWRLCGRPPRTPTRRNAFEAHVYGRKGPEPVSRHRARWRLGGQPGEAPRPSSCLRKRGQPSSTLDANARGSGPPSRSDGLGIGSRALAAGRTSVLHIVLLARAERVDCAYDVGDEACGLKEAASPASVAYSLCSAASSATAWTASQSILSVLRFRAYNSSKRSMFAV